MQSRSSFPQGRIAPFALLFLALSTTLFAVRDENISFFEKKIRPVLVDRCYKCHSEGAEKLKGGLFLDTREGVLRGGDTGPAIVPGNAEKSLLIAAIRWTDKDMEMPPKEKLPQEVIANFERWIKDGAVDPREGKSVAARPPKKWNTESAKQWWSFQPIKNVPAPDVKDTGWPRDALDRFVLAGLEAHELKPVGDTDKGTLVRRLYFDLVGLPPSLRDVEAFLADTSSNATEKLVDRLLASPQFGERWGRHWLDVARFAESGGKERNTSFPHAWRYRDYVIASFNRDVPYDRFIKEQIAGDLLPARDPAQRARQQIATGFLAIGTKPVNLRDTLQFRLDVADEQIDTVSQSTLGMTIACARCHDHKFDPITQKDYYAMAGIFASTETLYGGIITVGVNQTSPLLELPRDAGLPSAEKAMSPEQLETLRKQLDDAKLALATVEKDVRAALSKRDPVAYARRAAARGKAQEIERKIESYNSDGTSKNLAMGVREATTIADLPIYARGEIDRPGEMTPRGFVQVLSRKPAGIDAKSSGRLELSEWIASPDNPLTARVMVNRVWEHLMGKGIVSTPDNFGTTGQKPTHPELLDYLAATFIEQGWSVKKLIKKIVLSRTYQLDSTFNKEDNSVDPDNDWIWRKSKRRLDAEEIRDAMLAASGLLDLRPVLGSPVADLGEGFVAATFTELKVRGGAPGGGIATGLPGFAINNVDTRSVYLPVLRDLVMEPMALFDFAESSTVIGKREETTVPSQALYMMNSPFVLRNAEAMAARIIAVKSATSTQCVDLAFLWALGRHPTPAEVKAVADFGPRFVQASGQREALPFWTALCQSLFETAEFRSLN
jgi:hypothetical protein